MQELFFLVAKSSPSGPLEVCGCVTRSAAHRLGFPHTSVQLVPVTWDASREQAVLLLHKRSPYKWTCPNAWDFCGGHPTVAVDDCRLLQAAGEARALLERVTEEAALREANEELHCEPPFPFRPEHLVRLRAVGAFECETRSERGVNVEHSTAYVVAVPGDRVVSVWDTDAQGERQLEVWQLTWPELLDLYREEPACFADGAGRILDQVAHDPALQAEFERLIEEVGKRVARAMQQESIGDGGTREGVDDA